MPTRLAGFMADRPRGRPALRADILSDACPAVLVSASECPFGLPGFSPAPTCDARSKALIPEKRSDFRSVAENQAAECELETNSGAERATGARKP
jgi:hypothetical protein